MYNESLVSAIIIFFNADKYLAEAIESVFAQTYPHWELLLCDDGSTDGSTTLAQRYTTWFPNKVRYLEHAGHHNRGMSATRNLGLRHAKGDYIAWLDADDVWVPHKLQRQLQLMQEHPDVAMVYGPAQYWYSWTGHNADWRRDVMQDIGIAAKTEFRPPHFMMHILQQDTYVPAGVLVRRTVMETVGGYEEPFPDAHEDDIVYAKIGLQWPVLASTESWYRYRQHEESYCAWARRSVNERAERLIYLDTLADHMRTEGLDGGEAWHVVQDQRRENRNTLRNTTWEALLRGVEKGKNSYWAGAHATRRFAERLLPASVRSWLGVRLKGYEYSPPVGWTHWGGLRRLSPINRLHGCGRGTPCDQYYIETFFTAHKNDIRGYVLELGVHDYARRLGPERVTQCEGLHHDSASPRVTLNGDLCTGEGLLTNAFDCLILPELSLFVQNVNTALTHAVRSLKPGGVLLATLPGNTQSRRDANTACGGMLRFSLRAIQQIFEKHFHVHNLEINAHGNVLTAVALLHGIAMEELSPQACQQSDPDYAMIITVRAVKS